MNELLPANLEPYAPLIVGAVTALIIFVVGWIAAKWVYALCLRVGRRSSVDEALARFLASLAQYAVLALAVIASLNKVGVPTTSFVALVGAAGLAIGLALQGNLGHLASGVMLLLFRPFTIGDRVAAAGQNGKVADVGLFATTLLTPSNERIIIPNGSITSTAIVNYTVEGKLRVPIAVGVAYGTDLERATEVMLGACRRVSTVLEDPAPSVFFSGFGASSLDFEVRPWVAPDDLPRMAHELRLALNEDLQKAGIEIPFDQIVVHQAG